MSVLLWWLPAILVLAVAWWRLRPAGQRVRQKDLRTLQRALRTQR